MYVSLIQLKGCPHTSGFNSHAEFQSLINWIYEIDAMQCIKY